MLGLDEKFPEIQFLLGFLSFHGLGVPQDRTKAFSHYLEAAKAGCAAAQYAVAVMIESGQGSGSAEQAVQWLEEAAGQGHRSAAFDLGARLTSRNGSPETTTKGLA